MSAPKGKKTTTASRPRRAASSAMSLTTARQMLPLVGRIVRDVQQRWNRLSQLELEQSDLDLRRRGLDWPARSRRYQIADDITNEQRRLQEVNAELEQLSVILVDPMAGEAAFPTIINNRKAYFGWKLGDEDLAWWCYTNDPTRRTIPATWRREG